MSDYREGGPKHPTEPADLRDGTEDGAVAEGATLDARSEDGGLIDGELSEADTTVGAIDPDDTTPDVFEANRYDRATGSFGEPEEDVEDVMPEELQADATGRPLDGSTGGVENL